MTDEKQSPAQQEWHALEAEEVLNHLKVQDNGLTSEEAKRRLELVGPNQLKEAPRPTFLKMLWEQLNNFVVILLIVASVISALLGDYVEAAAIMSIVVLNAILGIVQEQRAEEALAALKKLAAPDAQVMRDGHRVSVPSYQLVPGDLVFSGSRKFRPRRYPFARGGESAGRGGVVDRRIPGSPEECFDRSG
ncbi:MAG TPA: cation-transporting P-type ATPase [Anaerolineales bacterium]|nr:cation-transporting P-type ATPase [Anaerolineales bacterium]